MVGTAMLRKGSGNAFDEDGIYMYPCQYRFERLAYRNHPAPTCKMPPKAKCKQLLQYMAL
jgi:hypothetical protein